MTFSIDTMENTAPFYISISDDKSSLTSVQSLSSSCQVLSSVDIIHA